MSLGNPLLSELRFPHLQNEAELRGSFQLWCSESSRRTCPHPAQPPGTPAFRAWEQVQGLRRSCTPSSRAASVSRASVFQDPSPGLRLMKKAHCCLVSQRRKREVRQGTRPFSRQQSWEWAWRQSHVRLSELGSGSPTLTCNRCGPHPVWIPAPRYPEMLVSE